MKKLGPIIILVLYSFTIQTITADNSLDIKITPEPIYDQVWAYEDYLINATIRDFNLSEIDLTGYSALPSDLSFTLSVKWRGKGGYDFGESTTGYNYDLDEISLNQEVGLSVKSILFTLTLEKDAFEYLMQPHENVEIILSFSVNLVMGNGVSGPRIVTQTITLYMVDEYKIDYLNGKYDEMRDEISTVIEATGLDKFNRERYLSLLNDMNSTLNQGNYISALEIWQDYDEDDRTDMIRGLIRATDEQSEEVQRLKMVEEQLLFAENQIELLENEYEQLEQQYAALLNTYHRVNAQLNAAKRNLTTAITAIFLTAIGFYFLGRRGAQKNEV